MGGHCEALVASNGQAAGIQNVSRAPQGSREYSSLPSHGAQTHLI